MSEAWSEFTGERLVPGEVDADLWNEHISRYAFAASLCKGGERVLDAGCGTGYGSSYLTHAAGSVLGIDYSADAISFAAQQYESGKLRFAVGLCESLPVATGAADLIVAFEVIEHLAGWRKFLEECERVLAPEGMLLVSTPNKNQYAESRGAAGPNPFHVHEFEFQEFSDELERIFPHVRLFGQSHVESIAFSRMGTSLASARFGASRPEPEHAGFFVAACGKQSVAVAPNFVYVPEAANVLRERERHIRLLAEELGLKNTQLAELHQEHAGLVGDHRTQIAEMERSNAWAQSLDRELQERGARIVQLQRELEAKTAWAESLDRELQERLGRVLALQQEVADEQSRFRSQLDRLEQELEQRTAWARELDLNLADRVAALAHCVDLLHAAEQTIDERTTWALAAQAEADASRDRILAYEEKLRALQTKLDSYEESRWVRVGRTLHVGPLSR